MASDIKELEILFKAQVTGVAEAAACFGTKFYNLKAPPGAAKPYAVFQVIPLPSNFGQARTSIQKVFLIDFRVISVLPLPDTVDETVAAVDEHFNNANTFTTANFRISIRHDKPLSVPLKGAAADEQLLMRGATYKAWVSRR